MADADIVVTNNYGINLYCTDCGLLFWEEYEGDDEGKQASMIHLLKAWKDHTREHHPDPKIETMAVAESHLLASTSNEFSIPGLNTSGVRALATMLRRRDYLSRKQEVRSTYHQDNEIRSIDWFIKNVRKFAASDINKIED